MSDKQVDFDLEKVPSPGRAIWDVLADGRKIGTVEYRASPWASRYWRGYGEHNGVEYRVRGTYRSDAIKHLIRAYEKAGA